MTVTGNRMEEDVAEPKGIQEQYLFSDDFDSFKPRRRIYERSPGTVFEQAAVFCASCIFMNWRCTLSAWIVLFVFNTCPYLCHAEPETSSGFELPRRFTIDCISARELEDLYRAYCAAEATTTRRRHIYDQSDKGMHCQRGRR
jgi:hypothetical protein